MSAHVLGDLTRERLPGRILFAIKRGGVLRPDVLLADAGGGPVVVKDWSPRPRWLRATLGRIALRREARAHRRLDGIACVPRLLGRLDSHALVLAYRAGTRISRRRPWIFHAGFVADLAAAVAEIHARGVVHLDLAHRGNVGADAAGRPAVFDLGSALCLRPAGRIRSWLLRGLVRVDRRALAKWRRRLAAEPPDRLSPAPAPGGAPPRRADVARAGPRSAGRRRA